MQDVKALECVAYAVHVAFHVELVCNTCTAQPQVASQSAKKYKHRFKLQRQVGYPWLQHANGVMCCIACKEYPQPGVQQSWLTGDMRLRRTTVVQHNNRGVHCKSPALWELALRSCLNHRYRALLCGCQGFGFAGLGLATKK